MPKTNFNWPVCSNRPITQYLQKIIVNNKLASAYLFCGPENVGKFHLAKILAQSVLCWQNTTSSPASKTIPCLKCVSCLACQKNIHPDLFIVKKDATKKNITLEEVKSLQRKLSATSLLSSLKIGLIDGADLLSLEAANALLKTIEEPCGHTLIIIIAHSRFRLLPTIVSRCSPIQFNLAPRKEIYSFLLEKDADKDTAKLIAELALGRPGIALRYLADPDLVEQIRKYQTSWLKLISEKPLARLRLAKNILPREKDRQASLVKTREMITAWQLTTRELIHSKLNTEFANLIPPLKPINLLSKKFKLNQLTHNLIQLNELKKSLNNNINVRARLENYLLTI